jgi:hypothetical protein
LTECGEIETPVHNGGMSNEISTRKDSIEGPQKIKNGTNIRFSNPTSGYLSKRTEIRASKKYLHSHVHCSTIHNSQYIETT